MKPCRQLLRGAEIVFARALRCADHCRLVTTRCEIQSGFWSAVERSERRRGTQQGRHLRSDLPSPAPVLLPVYWPGFLRGRHLLCGPGALRRKECNSPRSLGDIEDWPVCGAVTVRRLSKQEIARGNDRREQDVNMLVFWMDRECFEELKSRSQRNLSR